MTSRRAASSPTVIPASYEAATTELDALLAAMEGGQLPLDQLLSRYQRAAELLTFCRSRLDAVEQQVKVLEEGQMVGLGGTQEDAA